MKIKKVIKAIEADGWYLVRTKGSHRQYKHPTKPGKATIAGKASKDVDPGILSSISRQTQIQFK